MSEENKHKPLHEYLKGLPKVKSRNDFDLRLMSRLRNVESEKFSSPSVKKLTGKKYSILDFLKPSLIPAIGLTIILFVFIAYYINISQKDKNVNQISQNEKPVISGDTKEEEQNKVSDSFITKNETVPPAGYTMRNKEDQTKSPGSTVSGDYDIPPASGPETRHIFEQQVSQPKAEEKKSDELKTETDGVPKLDDKKETPVMKKSGEYKLKDKEKPEEYYKDENQINGKVDVNSSRSMEQGVLSDTSKAIDSTKIIKGKKSTKKTGIFYDSLKIPAQKPIQKEDTSKSK